MIVLYQIVILIFIAISVLGTNYPEVQLKQGVLRGIKEETLHGRPFYSFQGIPYAKPPIGKLRFKQSVPAEPWIGHYFANFTINCLQYDHATYKSSFPVHGSEDCLYINVYTPKLQSTKSKDERMNVIVYIHGGAFMFSAGHYYGPHYLLDKDVVLVTFNYRLGPLGFLSTDDIYLPGNNGLKDQVLALKWIKENIIIFGGNPENVTIAGMSAGGSSVHYHLLSPSSKGLFARAISLSGTALNPWAQTEQAKEKVHTIAEKLGCPTNDSKLLIKCLQGRSGKQIVETSKLFMQWLYYPFSPFGPVIEMQEQNAFINESPIKLMQRGKVNDVPWLISFSRDEGLYPGAEIVCDPDNYKNFQKKWQTVFPNLLDYKLTANADDVEKINKKIREKYLPINFEVNNVIEMLGDRLFKADIGKAGVLQSESMKSSVYAYQFSYRGQNSISDIFCDLKNIGVCHGDDSIYVLKSNYLRSIETEMDFKMINTMMEIWTTFAATGKPYFPGTDNWPTVGANLPKFTYLDITSPQSAQVIADKSLGNAEFWNSLRLNENTQENVKEEL